MKEAIPERVRFQPGNRRVRVAALARQHVVPLEDLVEHDPIDEAAQAYAEQNPRSPRAGNRALRASCTWLSASGSTRMWPG
jgi:hypothetical protein